MTTAAILLLLLSALLHAAWNLLSKRSRPTAAFFLLATAAPAWIALPWVWMHWAALARFPWQAWGLLALTGGFQALYYAALAGAYRHGELSVVYPLARALPVLLVAGVSLLRGHGDRLTPLGLAGMALVALGCWVLPPRNNSRLAPSAPRLAVGMAALAAVGTTGYTVIDDAALALLRASPGLRLAGLSPGLEIPWLYALLENWSILIWLGGLMRFNAAERQELRQLRRAGWRQAALAGFLILAAYALVLAAMGQARDVSYIAAFRQVSIPIGALLGIVIEKEALTLRKAAGIGGISLGLALTALG